jgi:hypothetical protein
MFEQLWIDVRFIWEYIESSTMEFAGGQGLKESFFVDQSSST